MKKLVFILMMFASIFSFAEMKDGTYSAEKNYDSEWKSIVKITVKRDKIIGAQFDRQNKNGQSLSLNKDDFRDSALNSSRELVSSQNANNVIPEFREIVKFLIQKANNGETGNHKM